jgi:hypothetical protein
MMITTDTSHKLRPQSLLHSMSTQVQKNPEERLVSIRIREKSKRRLALQGYTGQTFDQALQAALDRCETCRCRPIRRVSV